MHLLSSRRRFLASLGAGLSAPLLAPISRQLLSEAWGAPLSRRLSVFFVVGETIAFKDFVPAGVPAGTVEKFDPVERAGIAWPAMFDGLSAH
jgi:hypothetical protein